MPKQYRVVMHINKHHWQLVMFVFLVTTVLNLYTGRATPHTLLLRTVTHFSYFRCLQEAHSRLLGCS